MSIRVGINGLGRVGRSYLRRAAQTEDLEVVAVNDVADAVTLQNLLRRDSTFGRFAGEIVADGDVLLVDGRKIAVSAVREPAQLPWARARRRRGRRVHRQVPHPRGRRRATCRPARSGSSSPPPARASTRPS